MVSADVDYYNEFQTLETLYVDIVSDEYTSPGTVQAWYMSYRVWLNTSTVANSSNLLDSGI